MQKIGIILVLLFTCFVFSQTKQEIALAKETKELLYKASNNFEKGNFSEAEANYRKAIALDSKNTTAKYNLGNVYYKNKKNSEAGKRFLQAAEVATTKAEKHKVFHNLGNTFMNYKNYKAAVEAYKNALRSNPTDEETRYNLALAKKMLEEQGDEGGEDEKQEKDQDKQEEKQDKQEGDNQEEKQDQNKGDEGDDEKDSQNKEDKGDPKEEKKDQGQPQQVEGQLSPQQVQSLLEAMNNQEKKVQDKINAEKQKGVKTKPEKDW
ncbi:MAG: hypothetical protein CVU03_07710 [Bacteroidetes bacterium HGW-Bacteroidetes-2]|jgi:tetratricopeptide (TPR) repeat protein|nr:MAG: hypothetical protein CVU03_07710 [Bacteroidetes bacterium HGW-Bacteroidetes-2]